MKKLIALLLLAVLLCSMVACNNDPTPDGMQNVSIDTAPYNLYVPQNWITNASSERSSARAPVQHSAPNVAVDMLFPEGVLTAEDYWKNYCVPEYTATLGSITVIEDGADTVLGGKDAKQYTYTFTLGLDTHKQTQIIVVSGYQVYILTYAALADTYDTYAADFGEIVKQFTFK